MTRTMQVHDNNIHRYSTSKHIGVGSGPSAGQATSLGLGSHDITRDEKDD